MDKDKIEIKIYVIIRIYGVVAVLELDSYPDHNKGPDHASDIAAVGTNYHVFSYVALFGLIIEAEHLTHNLPVPSGYAM